MHARAVTLGDVQTAGIAARAACDAMDPFKLDIAIAAAVRARGGDRAATTSTARATAARSRWSRASSALSSLAFRRRNAAARGGHLRRPDGAPGVPRRLPDEEQHHAVRRRCCCCSTRSAATPTRAALRDAPWRSSSPASSLTPRRRGRVRRPATSSGSSSSSACRCSPGRALRSRALLQAELREKAERAERDRVERSHARRSRTSACASPPSSRSWWRTASARWWSRRGPCRAPSTAGDTRARRRGARGGRDDGPRGARRDAHAARRAAPRGRRRRRSRRSRAWRASRRSSERNREARPRRELELARRAARAAAGSRPDRIPRDRGRARRRRRAARAERADVLVRYTAARAAAAGERRPRGRRLRAARGPPRSGRPLRRPPARGRLDGGGFRAQGQRCRSRSEALMLRAHPRAQRGAACARSTGLFVRRPGRRSRSIDLATNSELEGPLWLNIAVMTGDRAVVPVAPHAPIGHGRSCTLVGSRRHGGLADAAAEHVRRGAHASSAWATRPGATWAAARARSRLALGAAVIVTLAIVYDPSDIFFPVTFFWIVPWVVGRTLRNQTLLTRELAEKAERAQHAREEDERRAIAARAQPDRARAARRARAQPERDGGPGRAARARCSRRTRSGPSRRPALIERTGREALAELRHLFGPVRRGDGASRCRAPRASRASTTWRAGARDAGPARGAARDAATPVELPAGIDLAAYRIVQEALTNTLKHSPGARARVTVAYEPNEVRAERRGRRRGPARRLRAGRRRRRPRPRRACASAPRCTAASCRRAAEPDGGFAVRARLPTRACWCRHEHPRAARGRPGADPRRLPDDPRRRGGHGGRGRVRRRHAGGGQRTPARPRTWS